MRLPTSPPPSAIAAIGFGLVSLMLAWATGGISSSLINPDEGGHYVNALFLGDWIRAGFPSPMAFAQDYYAHFPRLSIGHWPPGWYMAEAPIFALFRPSPLGALAISAFVAGLPGGAVVWAMARIRAIRIGLAMGLAYVLLPLVVDGGRYLLLDQPVALIVALGAIAWVYATDSPNWRRFLIFALLAAAAPLVKGNGALIALVPAIDLVLGNRWRLLRQPGLWTAALLTLLIVAPWYWFSAKISAGGFVYAPGLEYSGLAISANSFAIWANSGVGGLALAGLGTFAGLRAAVPGEKRIAQIAVAVVVATFVFQAIVPAAIDPRYMAPMMPWMLVLAGLGIVSLLRTGTRGRVAAALLAATAMIPSLIGIASLSPKPDLGAPAIAQDMVRDGGLWIVDGRSGDEGALIAEAAYADRGAKQLWLSRASQWLSTSDFLGRGYALTATTPAQARGVLDRIGAGGAVSVAERNRLAYPHSRILRRAVADGYVIDNRSFRAGDGSVLVAGRANRVAPNIELIEQNGGSANVAKMRGALP